MAGRDARAVPVPERGVHVDREETPVLYMVIERFRGGDPRPVYARVRERGRMLPDGLEYVNSWVTADLGTCYQLMECTEPALLGIWSRRWSDLVDFEFIPVMSSAEAAARAAGPPG
jgi:hypothetical protein